MHLLARVLDLQKSKRRVSVLLNVKIITNMKQGLINMNVNTITNMKQGLMNVLPLDPIHVLSIPPQGLITRLKATTKESIVKV